MEVVTRYARSGDLQIAYQAVGEPPLDVVVVPSFFSNIEIDWELPPKARFLGHLASFARLIQFDRRGARMSGGITGATPPEEQIDDEEHLGDGEVKPASRGNQACVRPGAC
jgi:hypothetical protein